MKLSLMLKAIRTKCLDCSNQQIDEVRNCVISNCPLYPYRMGKNPFTNRKGNPNAFGRLNKTLESKNL
jgi:hypothetical protein